MINVDKVNNRAEFDATDETWTSLGNGTNDTLGALAIIKEITNDAASPLIAHIDNAPELPITTNGGVITWAWNAEGIIQLA